MTSLHANPGRSRNLEWLVLVLAVAVFPAVIYL